MVQLVVPRLAPATGALRLLLGVAVAAERAAAGVVLGFGRGAAAGDSSGQAQGLGAAITVMSSGGGAAGEAAVAQLAAGGYHSAAVTHDGTLLTWGEDQHGQLGRPAPSASAGAAGAAMAASPPSASPQPAQLGHGCRAVEVALGSQHTVVLCADGSVRTCGRNVEGQLGLGLGGGGGVHGRVTPPREVAALGEDNAQVIAGGYHTLVLKSSVRGWRPSHPCLCCPVLRLPAFQPDPRP
jgi:hypothetical protein